MYSKLFDKTLKGTAVYGFDKPKDLHPPGIKYVIEDTICEIHRQIYDNLIMDFHDRPESLEKIVPLLEKAFVVGVKITKKLVDNKCGMPDWEINYSVEEVIHLRKLRIELARKLEEAEKVLK